jgi:hypothetical protein
MKFAFKKLMKAPYLIGAVILFFLLLYFMNRGGGASSSTVTTGTTTDPNAALAMQLGAQVQAAQINAGVQMAAIQADYAKTQDSNSVGLAIAQLQANNTNNQTAAEKDIATATLALQAHQSDLAYEQSVNNNNFALGYAQEAYNYTLANTAMNVDLQKTLASDQLKGYEFGQEASIIANFGNPARRQDLMENLITSSSGVPVTTDPSIKLPSGGGGFNPLAAIGGVVGIAAAAA